MNVEIKVILTQIAGFLIVLWVLRKYAWGPILAHLEERREKIRGSFADIDSQKGEVAALKAQYEGELRKIDAMARQRINEVMADAQKMAAEIEASARDRSRAELDKLKEDIEREYHAARIRLKEEIVNVALTASEKMVREKLDKDRQRKLVDDFLNDVSSVERPSGS
jgi:F-type H+-transporting ATPase subunit b